MELKHIELANLAVSGLNMRGKGKSDIANILPSVRARGVLVPLIVRANGTPDTYEIVAGKRRYQAARAVAEETGEQEALPCAVIEAGDDAAALEASLIENVARLDPDEVTRWESFTRLVREGRRPEQIAATFGLTELQVKRTLALGNLLPRIRNLYRRGEIDAATVRHLTLISKAQQQAWLALFDTPGGNCPTGSQLKAWAFGGASIPVSAALFDVDSYTGGIVSDLFGEDRYFIDAAAFWTAQNGAVEANAEAYREAGWSEVLVLGQGEYFQSWEHERCPKRKGGRVYIAVSARGDVAFHEGYVTLKEARKLAKGEAIERRSVRRSPVASRIMSICTAMPPCGPRWSKPASIWITETTLGGAGALQSFAERFAAEPSSFFDAVEAALAPTDLELVDGGLRRILALAAGDPTVAEGMGRLRGTESHAQSAEIWRDLSSALTQRGGVDLSHALVVAFNSRLLRSGAGPALDILLASLTAWWDELEDRLGISLGLREFAFAVSRDQVWRVRIGQYLAATLPAAAVSGVSVYAAVLSMLWAREGEVRRTSLQSYNPYRDARATDPAVVRALLLRRTIRTVELSAEGWREALESAFAEDGACRLGATNAQSRELRSALVTFGATPIDVGVLQFFPAIERIERGEDRILVDLILREHA